METLADVEVEYITLPGWKTNIRDIRKYSDLPANAKSYIEKVQEILQIPGECFNHCACIFVHSYCNKVIKNQRLEPRLFYMVHDSVVIVVMSQAHVLFSRVVLKLVHNG